MAKNNSQSTKRTAAPKTTPQPTLPAAPAEQTKDVIADANEEKEGVNQDPATGIREDVESAPVDPTLPAGAIVMTAPNEGQPTEEQIAEGKQFEIDAAVRTILNTNGIEAFDTLIDIINAKDATEARKIVTAFKGEIEQQQADTFEDDDDDSKLRLLGKGQVPDKLESGATLFAGFDKNLRIGSFVGKKGHKFRIDTKAASFDDDHGRRIHQYMITHVPQKGEEDLPLKASFFRGTFEEL